MYDIRSEGRTPIVIVQNSSGEEIAGTLDASYYKGAGLRQGIEREVIAEIPESTRGGQSEAYCMGNGQLAQTNLSDKARTLDCMHDQQAIIEKDKVNSVARRLTPLECERLQGFPDGWTDLGEWIDSKGKKHREADSPRYKALGNSIALPFWEWMAARMVKQLGKEDPTMGSLFDGIGGFPLAYSRCGCRPVWASEIEEFPIAVTKLRFPE